VKRSASLAALSRDHHEALAVARRLRTATEQTAGDALAGFDSYLHDRGEPHFELEERVLLPALEAFAEGVRFAWRLRDEHRWVRVLSRRTRRPDEIVERAHDLGDVLHDHVRFEERVVFPFLEESMSSSELAALARRLGDD
jgi:hemerythrin-like domain-containing protein